MMSKITFGEIIESIVMIVSIIVGLIFISVAVLIVAPAVIAGYFGIYLITTFMDYVDELKKDH